ncbi:nicotinate-nucleotide adenylyltransferase [Bosea sp. (in: a-proteobacteria)]|uniref:nicotinate-nucleotide adenylyltransferase n=1 Tax=Bosea sp. (in: a-proteobacteria) TaxID=1871050 RepID=UPI00086D970D|nr:nicotinate-nucleotide adenylyltransferase [Bosea sp. (in: a-proteobacteria)]MBN9438847.1 nicotinate-nucleotide adenylyltransferase [Bosea sp. (in: a-proteobacteria)]MBN9445818.1 nicotinate-nucleotide adenylyltransferase [Bosea sp. (in: a-proteobacteria)]MBN9471042.1 nicotinate-nucleotide adenylyltransferase [Bosea sp. (in: a-proteobacteria)]ODT54813.1 MAG: nicotinic acid mononucleotide adenylyltransferase [Methylobacterium sp. SCN 67-24]
MSTEDLRLPPYAPGLRIGLFGGSFNPAHDGHRMASLTALRRLQLDRVWWLVSPGNPLKDNRALPPLAQRIAFARNLADHGRIHITGIEAGLRTRYTADTLRALKRRCPGVRFVWIMGSDNLASFHRWNEWRAIARMMPIAVIDRPGTTHRSVSSPAGNWLARWRLPENQGGALAVRTPPAWIFLHGRRSDLSSTQLRENAENN